VRFERGGFKRGMTDGFPPLAIAEKSHLGHSIACRKYTKLCCVLIVSGWASPSTRCRISRACSSNDSASANRFW